MSYNKPIDYENIDINKILFIDFKGDDDISNDSRSLFCRYDNKTLKFKSPSIEFTSDSIKSINLNFLQNNFYIPINNVKIQFTNKLIEFQHLLESQEFKEQYHIPLDYQLSTIIKDNRNSQYSDQFKTKINLKTNVYQIYSYKDNSDKIFKKKIYINKLSDLCNLINKNTFIKSTIQPFKLWISKPLKLYSLIFNILDIEIHNLYNYQSLLLEEEDIINNY